MGGDGTIYNWMDGKKEGSKEASKEGKGKKEAVDY